MIANAEDPRETRLSGAVIPIHARTGSGPEGGGEAPRKHHHIRQAAAGRLPNDVRTPRRLSGAARHRSRCSRQGSTRVHHPLAFPARGRAPQAGAAGEALWRYREALTWAQNRGFGEANGQFIRSTDHSEGTGATHRACSEDLQPLPEWPNWPRRWGRGAMTVPHVQAEPLWTVDDVSRYLKASRSWVYQKAEAGLLPSLRIGGLLRFDPVVVQAWAREEMNSPAVLPMPRSAP